MAAAGAGCSAGAGGGGDGGGGGPSSSSGGYSRDITISLVVSEGGKAGLIRVQDNGRGMSPKELGDWAVMNLSMEDRGLLPNTSQRITEAAGGGRYLSGDLSFFGVGSKNAAFFMGSSVKLATRQAGSGSVHELAIAGAELERRYKCGESVYEEDLVHRQPGDSATLTQQ
ncbi:Structural maintenance of chromosomes flexible hinge domain-containing protein 1, partial [Tetrabaena socialis]